MLFEPTGAPRVFAMPPGADFPAALVAGLLDRSANLPPEALARVTLLVNTRRMARRLTELFATRGPLLLPRIGLVTDPDFLDPLADAPPALLPLSRQLDLARLIAALLDADPTLAPRSATLDLAESLAGLIDEMQGEGVALDTLESIDTGDLSEHWQRGLAFLGIARRYLDATAGTGLDPEARRRRIVLALAARWTAGPPAHPVIVAGSTGSRGTTQVLMQAVARLPQGALILPGFDFDLPSEAWPELAEDHPQYRFAHLLAGLSLSPADVAQWPADTPDPDRNRLISLSLRPAPVTHQWLTDGPHLGDLRPLTENLALIEAPQPRDEASAIAVALRQAVEVGRTAALITPDRTLGRRVAAALARWDIVPDDSGGHPLNLTAPGRFLRQTAQLIGGPVPGEALIALLKHPLTRTGGGDRGPHLRLTRELELYFRREAVTEVTPATLQAAIPGGARPWLAWLADTLAALTDLPGTGLAALNARHRALAEAIAQGPGTGSGALWDKAPGRDTRAAFEALAQSEPSGATVTLDDYRRILDAALAAGSTRADDGARRDVMIWGTLEARVQGADLVILGGLNEGVWPEAARPDPWLNRKLRQNAGLFLPERRIGLSAHDYQQAAAAPRVILSRARRDAETETVPSRWLNRLQNLLNGLPVQNGPESLKRMKAKGDTLLDLARALDTPARRDPAAQRPAPAPSPVLRPKSYAVTDIRHLIRDPYAIYARRILNLRKLDPLSPEPSAALKGTVFHEVLQAVFAPGSDLAAAPDAAVRLLRLAEEVLARRVYWPAIRTHWLGHLRAIAPRLIEDEIARLAEGRPGAVECYGETAFPGAPFSVHGRADRIDILADGRLAIYDYKLSAPSAAAVRHFDRQLLIEAVMAEAGGFPEIGPAEVAHVAHIGLSRSAKYRPIALVKTDKADYRTVTVSGELLHLLAAFDAPDQGYASRRAMEKLRYSGDFDHLARFGEWSESDLPATEVLR